jgi:hypothetical protein
MTGRSGLVYVGNLQEMSGWADPAMMCKEDKRCRLPIRLRKRQTSLQRSLPLRRFARPWKTSE